MLKRITFGLLPVLVVIVFAVIVLGQKTEPPQSFRMADGTKVTLCAVTYGATNTVVWGKPYQKSLYKLLPAKLKSWSGCEVVTRMTADTNDPVFWMHFSKGPTKEIGPRLLDEYGCEFDLWWGGMAAARFGEGEQIRNYQIGVTSPHGRIVGICMYDSLARAQKVGQFLIPGTHLSARTEAKQPLPEPSAEGGLEFRLSALVTGLSSDPHTGWGLSNSIPFTEATLRVSQEGKPVPEWVPTNVKITSADGHEIHPRFRTAGHHGEDIVYNFEGLMDPSHGPFKFEFEFEHQGDFAPEDLVTFTNVAFPVYKAVAELNLTTQCRGKTVTLVKTYGAFSQRSLPAFGTEQPVIEGNIAPVTKGLHLDLMRATGRDGRVVISAGQAGIGNGKYIYAFQQQTNSDVMDLTFAIYTSRYVEFTATPGLFATNAGVGK